MSEANANAATINAVKLNTRLNTRIKLSFGRKLLYALGDGGNNFSYSLVTSFLVFYCTDVFGIGAGAVGAIMLASRFWDAVNDPIIGGMADRTRTKWGTYRPWMIFSSVPLVILTILCFSPVPIASEGGKIAYMTVVFIVLVTVYTCVNVPYSAMTAVLTQDTDERASLTTFRLFIAVLCGVFVIGQITLPLVSKIGGGDMAKGFFGTSIVYGGIAMLLFVLCFKGTREIVPPQVDKQTFKQMAAAMKGNKPAWILGATFLVQGLFTYGRVSTYMYYFTYNAGSTNRYTEFMLYYGIASLIGVLLVPLLGRHVKNKSTLPKWGYIGSGVLMIISFFISPVENWMLFVIVNFIVSAIMTGAATMMYGMVPDCTEYGEYKTGIRAAGFISAFVNFMMKCGMAVGTAGIGFILAALHYQAGADQPLKVLTGINTAMNLLPGVLAIVSGIMLFAYKLDRDTYYQMLNEMDTKNAKEGGQG